MRAGRLVVVGGGIVGLATAHRLQDEHPGTEVVVAEKEAEVGRHQTGHNSGVVHAGLYYEPGSLKADLCRRGRRMLREFCAGAGLPFDECGKVVVARDAAELGPLARIEERALANGVPGLRRLDRAGLAEVEPHAAGVGAVDGGVDLGPNAVLGLALEGYRRRDVDPAWLGAALRDPAMWRMARAHWRTGLHELAGSLSKSVFVARAASLVPGLRPGDVERAPAGVRAQALGGDGRLLDDFRIRRIGPGGRVVAVLNAPSPAATSSLAVAEHIGAEVARL